MTLLGSSIEELSKQQAATDFYLNDRNHIPRRSLPPFEDLSRLAAAVALVGAFGTTTQRSLNPPVTLEVDIQRPILYSPTLSPLNYSPQILPLSHSSGSVHEIPLPELPSSGKAGSRKDSTVTSSVLVKKLTPKRVTKYGAKHTYKNRNGKPQRPQPMGPPPPLPSLKPWQKLRSIRK